MRGRTPLHISCRGNHHDLTVALVQNGALATIKDNDGDCPLHMAAVSDSRTLLDMVDLCFAEPKESMELIIEALELTALLKSCPDPLECMRKATQLRVKHNIQKRILKPMECYGFIKEWETIEELEAYRGDEKKLKLQAVLARERIHQGQNAKLIQLFDEELISGILATCKSKVGKLLERHLEICSCKGDAHQFLEIAMQGWKNEIEQNFDLFDTQDIVKLIQVAIKSMPDVKGYSTLLATITTMVMKLYRRNRQLEDTSKNEQMLANKLLEELFDTVPVAIDNNFKPIPLQHLISKINFHVPTFETDIISREPYDYDLMKMLLESGKCKLNAVDALGNTLLHSAIDSINNDLRDCETRDILCQGTISQSIPAIKLLLEKGVYPNARNVYYYTARYMLPMEVVDEYDYDYLINVEAETVGIRELLQQYEDQYSMTLLTKAAVVVSGLPYKDHLKGLCPDGLIDFVNLHGNPNHVDLFESCCEDDDK